MAYCKPEKTGKDANPNGRPKGSITRTTSIRQALNNLALNDKEQSLEDFCKFIKETEPVEFFKAWIKLAPQKIESDNKHDININLTDNDISILKRLTGGKNDIT
jgi:hypothetical protein